MSTAGKVNSEIPLSHSSVILGKCSRAGLVLFIFKQRRKHTTETHSLQVQTHRQGLQGGPTDCLPQLLLSLHGDQEHVRLSAELQNQRLLHPLSVALRAIWKEAVELEALNSETALNIVE